MALKGDVSGNQALVAIMFLVCVSVVALGALIRGCAVALNAADNQASIRGSADRTQQNADTVQAIVQCTTAGRDPAACRAAILGTGSR